MHHLIDSQENSQAVSIIQKIGSSFINKELFQEAIRGFAPVLSSNNFEKGRLLHQAGNVSFDLYLVKSGALRSFYYVDGRDVTAHFALEYGVVGAADSIIRG